KGGMRPPPGPPQPMKRPVFSAARMIMENPFHGPSGCLDPHRTARHHAALCHSLDHFRLASTRPDGCRPLRLLPLPAVLAATCALAGPALALTARDLSGRIDIDGYTSEFIPADEDVFGIDPRSGQLQESVNDSPWQNNEIY